MNPECNCNSKKVRPNETCLFCCHKHLASALALINDYLKDDLNLLRAASQIKLAAWHFDKNFEDFVKRCNIIIDKIFAFQSFKTDLISLTEDTWELVKDPNLNKSFPYFNTNITALTSLKPSFTEGMLNVANAVELYYYEDQYQEINESYVIGQLNLATWNFQKDYQNYSMKCRLMYNKFNTASFKIDELIEFSKFLWQKYKFENCITKNDLFNL